MPLRQHFNSSIDARQHYGEDSDRSFVSSVSSDSSSISPSTPPNTVAEITTSDLLISKPVNSISILQFTRLKKLQYHFSVVQAL
jgi:hypothetical protein